MNIEAITRAALRQASHQPAYVDTPDIAWNIWQALPDLINGAPEHFRPLYISAGLSAAYHWPDDDLVLQFGAEADGDTLRDRVVREAAVYAERLAGTIADEAKRISTAMVIATARATSRRVFGFSGNDVSNNQRLANVAHIFAAPAAAAGGAAVARGTIAAPRTDADLDATLALCQAWWNAQRDVMIPKLNQMAVGAPIMNGVVLVFTQAHHFVDPHKQVMRVLTKQIFGSADPGVPNLSTPEFEDALFHKAFHPIVTARLVWMARNANLKTNVKTLGLGGAVVRCPASYPSERAMSAIRALLVSANACAAEYNININFAAMTTAMNDVAMADAVTPQAISDHADDVARFVAAHGAGIAWCAGLVSAMAEDTPPEIGRVTTVRAESIRRIIREFPAMSAAGNAHYRMVRRWQRAQAAAGKLPGVGLFGAEAPAERGNPEAVN